MPPQQHLRRHEERSQRARGRRRAAGRRAGAVGTDVGAVGSSRAAVSRRIVKGTEKELTQLFSKDLGELTLLACFIDGMAVGDHTLVVALAVDDKGVKHPLGPWEGTSTENKAVCRGADRKPHRPRPRHRIRQTVRDRRRQGGARRNQGRLAEARPHPALPHALCRGADYVEREGNGPRCACSHPYHELTDFT
ncbi:MAG TPA: hypothetical protein VFF07_01705 [Actinomycetota bacterium]|nr:hypothetical protein [Actinomycetota bacterium]